MPLTPHLPSVGKDGWRLLHKFLFRSAGILPPTAPYGRTTCLPMRSSSLECFTKFGMSVFIDWETFFRMHGLIYSLVLADNWQITIISCRLLMAKPSRDGKEKVKANRKSLSYPPQTPSKHSAVEERSCEVRPPSSAERSPAFLHAMKARNEPSRRSTRTTLLSQSTELKIQVDSCSRLSDELSLNLYHV